MARKKEFDPQKAIHQAMEVFWQKGYEATSIDDLCQAMDIRRGSLYSTFKDKRSLYIEAVNQYVRMNYPSELPTAMGMSPLEALQYMFQTMVDDAVDDKQQRGCFMINTITELSNSDDKDIAEIAQLCNGNVSKVQQLFVELLTEAQSQGEMGENVDLEAKAQFLMNSLMGIRITGMVTRDRIVLENIMREALYTLQS